MKTLAELLDASASLHARLCPRQVLGVRMSLLAGQLLAIEVPQRDKRLLAIVETDGCAADGVAVGSGCWIGRRSLRVEDFGKVAATFVDTVSGRAVQVVPRPAARWLALDYAPEARDRWHAQLIGYQRMPDPLLLAWSPVILTRPLQALVGQPGVRVACDRCGEEIMNRREVVRASATLCRACAGQAYYRLVASGSLEGGGGSSRSAPGHGVPQPALSDARR